MSTMNADNMCRSSKTFQNFTILWVIENVDALLSGKKFESAVFPNIQMNIDKWKLTAFAEKNGDIVILNISPVFVPSYSNRLCEQAASATVEVSILDSEKRVTLTKVIKEKFSYKSNHQIKFYDIICLYENNFFRNDEVNVFCKITIFGIENISIAFQKPPINVPFCDLKEHFSILLDSGMLSDVVLSCDGNNLPAHKIVLASRSPVFKSMFSCEMSENTQNRVVIDDVTPDVLKEVLRYMYSGNCSITYNIARDLLYAAEKYELPRLKMMIANFLQNIISVDNVCDIFASAVMYNISELIKKARDFIRFNKVLVTSRDGWKIISEDSELLKYFETK